MDTAVIVAVITAAVSIAGWFANHVLAARSERKRLRLTAQLAQVDKQLEELYGPLAFLVYEGRATFQDLLDTLGRDYVFADGRPLPQDELRLWLFWVDHDLMPRNAAIQELLSSKAHLIVGGDIPDSYLRFLDHYNSWRVTHERWKTEGIAYSWHSKMNWPLDFDHDVITSFRQLRRRHAELIGEVSGDPDR